MYYPKKIPRWFQQLYPNCLWSKYTEEKVVYLSFDDGPEPEVTPWVLEQLALFNARATFFCLGKNVAQNPDLAGEIIAANHSIGNHTFDHLNGWKTEDDQYLYNISKAHQDIQSRLFRPPYGRIKRSQIRKLKNDYTIVMWDVLSGDFDQKISPNQCLQQTVEHVENGSIIVFHDSIKAKKNLEYVLPRILNYFCEQGIAMKALPKV